MSDLKPDVLVVGAGPAGLAAALTAAQGGCSVLLLDANPAPGGQLWRGVQAGTPGEAGKLLLDVQTHPGIQTLCGAEVIWVEGRSGAWTFQVGALAGGQRIRPARVIVATGATERFLPFPGWTLPGVVGAGGLQAMVKSGLDVRGKRVVVAGSGPLLLAVAATLNKQGARVLALAEQTPLRKLARFGLHALGKGRQAAQLLPDLRGVPIWPDTYPVRASGAQALESVTLRRGGRERTLQCDWLAAGFGLLPDLRLATMLGCETAGGAVKVDAWNQTSLPGVYAAGESTGIGGVDKALAEGRRAGAAASGQVERLRGPPPREQYAPFVQALARDFALRPELRALPGPDTIICRCEDVTHAQLQACPTWTAAKLYTRCGMGACQGRICAPAAETLYGWPFAGVRPPLAPTPISHLLLHPQEDTP